MTSFNDLEKLVLKEKKPEEYLSNYFVKQNFEDYLIDERCNDNQLKAIKLMFESKKKIRERIKDVQDIDPFNLEAFLCYYVLNESLYCDIRFRAYLKFLDDYGSLDEYEKYCFGMIMDFYVDFNLEINNLTQAKKNINILEKLNKNYHEKNLVRLAYIYFSLEDSEAFYRLYLDNEFKPYEYLLCLLTLLKNDEELKASEVLKEFFKHFDYGKYFDYDLKQLPETEESKEFIDLIYDCYEDLESVPTFFLWVKRIREKDFK